MSFGLYDIRAPWALTIQMVNADGTGRKVLYTFTSSPVLVTDIGVTNSDTIDHVLNLDVYTGSAYRRLGSLNIPAGQGYAGTPPLFLTATLVPLIFGALSFPSGWALHISCDVAVTGAYVVDVCAYGGYV